MKRITNLQLQQAPRIVGAPAPIRSLHSSAVKAANVAPVVGTGPPPEPPTPEAVNAYQRVDRRRRQAEVLKNARDIRSAKGSTGGALKKRFWKVVTVEEVDGALQVHLDERPLRHPVTKEIVRLPPTKKNLASAIAVEWDLLTSSKDATREHLIPLTSLTCRALDIAADDKSNAPEDTKIRATIASAVLRFLDTDSMLCWAPPATKFDLRNDAGESLREVQKQVTEEICGFLTTHVWPGITIRAVLDGDAIMPRPQEAGVRELIQGWIMGLNAYEIAGIERATLAGKSLITAARLVTEWSEGAVGAGALNQGRTFGVEEAASATSLEVTWQTGQWGEVEDTHDVQKEDVRRQLGSVVLLVSGTHKTS